MNHFPLKWSIWFGYGAMFSMENLDNQTFTSKNHNLGHERDTNVKRALISITLAAKIF